MISQKPCWQVKKLLISHGVIALLLLSWFLSITHPFWEVVDKYFYALLCTSIKNSPFWQGFWMISNHNLIDWLHDVVMLAFLGSYCVKVSDKTRSKKIVEVIFFALVIAATILAVNRFLFLKVFEVSRLSPSMIYDFGKALTHFSWIKVKSHSSISFPGDHGTSAFFFTMIVWHLMGRRAGILAFIYSIYWQLPRLISGCHWFTDVIMGSLSIVTIVMSWLIYTPFKEWLTNVVSSLFVKQKEVETTYENKPTSL